MPRIHGGTPATAVRSGSRPAPPDSRYLADQKGSGRPLRYRIEAMKIISRPLFAGGSPQKNTACGLVRRGFHVGSPLERFRHSLAEYDGRSLRTTSYAFSRIQRRLRHVKFMMVLQPYVSCHKFRLSTEFTRDALTGRPLRYRMQAMKGINLSVH